MTKLIRTALILFVFGLIAFGVFGLVNSSKPPSPTITVGETQIPSAQGTYCWSGFINSICEDMISPPGIIAHHDLKPVVVSPEAQLKIDYKNKPKKDTLGANIWLSNEKAEPVKLSGNTLAAPRKKGVYIYDIHAIWEKGDSSHAFIIEVR